MKTIATKNWSTVQTGVVQVVNAKEASFALTTWTTPVWTVDQFLVAIVFTTYCIIAPRFKEKRFEKKFGVRFTEYKSKVPYMIPTFSLKK